jgi:hypothetical protein
LSHRDATQDQVQTGSKKNSTSIARLLLRQPCRPYVELPCAN